MMKFVGVSLLLLCTACGSRGTLAPQAGKSYPVKAYAQKEEQSLERLLQTSSQARPNRESELLSRSTVRTEDPFDLPPENDDGEIPDDLDEFLSEEDIQPTAI